MFTAKDKNGVIIDIRKADIDEDYYCPCCNSDLVQKRGVKKVWHYAHKSLKECDSFYEPMTEWHRDWQDMFPEACRELVVKDDSGWHRADVIVENTVIEFQHSYLTADKIEKRTKFYKDKGYDVLWVVDKRDKTPLDTWDENLNLSPLFINCNFINRPFYSEGYFIPLMNAGVDYVAYDCGRYILICWGVAKLLDKCVCNSFYVVSKDLFVDLIKTKEGITSIFTKQLSVDKVPHKMLLDSIKSYCEEVICKNGVSVSKASKLIKVLLDDVLGRYALFSYGSDGWLIENKKRKRNCFSTHLVNAYCNDNEGAFEEIIKSFNGVALKVICINIDDVVDEIKKQGYLYKGKH